MDNKAVSETTRLFIQRMEHEKAAQKNNNFGAITQPPGKSSKFHYVRNVITPTNRYFEKLPTGPAEGRFEVNNQGN